MPPFKKINDSFTCQNCGHENPPLSGSCRNHCVKCLYSVHLDKDCPGDRSSSCKGLMKPTKASHSGKKGWMITHKCTKCGKKILNKAAEDDNFDLIIELTQL